LDCKLRLLEGTQQLPDIHRSVSAFAGVADAYETGHPDYPPEAVAWMTSGVSAQDVVLDLAAGNGKLTRLLLATDASIVAVEPIEAFRRAFGELSRRSTRWIGRIHPFAESVHRPVAGGLYASPEAPSGTTIVVVRAALLIRRIATSTSSIRPSRPLRARLELGRDRRCNTGVKRLVVLAGIAAVVSFAAGAARGAQSDGALFGIVGSKVLYQQLVRFDPVTLAPLPDGVPLAAHRAGWSFSPGGRELVLGRNGTSCAKSADLRLVDVAEMRLLGDVRLGVSGPVHATAWTDSTHVLAVIGPASCGGAAQQTRLVGVDVESRRVVSKAWLRGTMLGLVRLPGEVVLLLRPSTRIGSATIAVVDENGAVRKKTLEGVPAGRKLPNGRYVSESVEPGLAVDAAGGRAFVVAAENGVTEIDLRTLRADYRLLSERTLAKSLDGSERSALWLGNGLLAVTGSDSVSRRTDGHPDGGTTPLGLRIVDTRTWTFRTLDPQVSSVRLAGDVLLAQGSTYGYDGSHTTETTTGLIAYSRAGRELYRVFEKLPVGMAVAIAGRGYATVGGPEYANRTVAFDLATGAVGRMFAQQLWELLL
jgi:hypothetical protein